MSTGSITANRSSLLIVAIALGAGTGCLNHLFLPPPPNEDELPGAYLGTASSSVADSTLVLGSNGGAVQVQPYNGGVEVCNGKWAYERNSRTVRIYGLSLAQLQGKQDRCSQTVSAFAQKYGKTVALSTEDPDVSDGYIRQR